MLEKESIIIFPDKSIKMEDGMPNFSVVYEDIKKI